MEKALLAANGTCIPAGGTFSFLGTVGSCDKAHGYRVAGVLVNGKHDVRTTAAASVRRPPRFTAPRCAPGWKIVERYNHAMPSTYCSIGQDATVSYPDLDMKLKNTTDYPVYIVTSVSGRTLTATFYGYQPPTITIDRNRLTGRQDLPGAHNGEIYGRQQPRGRRCAARPERAGGIQSFRAAGLLQKRQRRQNGISQLFLLSAGAGLLFLRQRNQALRCCAAASSAVFEPSSKRASSKPSSRQPVFKTIFVSPLRSRLPRNRLPERHSARKNQFAENRAGT